MNKLRKVIDYLGAWLIGKAWRFQEWLNKRKEEKS